MSRDFLAIRTPQAGVGGVNREQVQIPIRETRSHGKFPSRIASGASGGKLAWGPPSPRDSLQLQRAYDKAKYV